MKKFFIALICFISFVPIVNASNIELRERNGSNNFGINKKNVRMNSDIKKDILNTPYVVNPNLNVYDFGDLLSAEDELYVRSAAKTLSATTNWSVVFYIISDSAVYSRETESKVATDFYLYNDFGMNRKDLEDLLMFYSSTEKKLVSLASYVERMKEDQKYIYYAVGSSYDRMERSPQTERVADLGYEILYFKEDIDEFAIKMLVNYKEKEFKSVASGDLGLPKSEEEEKEQKEFEAMLEEMKTILDSKVSKVTISKHLKTHPVCLTAEGDISIEMEKLLSQTPDGQMAKAQKVLELNETHPMFTSLKENFTNNKEKFELYTKILFDQALILEGLEVEDPIEYANRVCQLMN